MSQKPLLFLSPLHRAIRQIGIHLAERLASTELQGTEGHLLSFLRSCGPVSVAEIARVLGTRKSTLTSILDRLEGRGLLRRRVHPEDRRSFLVELTAGGRRTAGEVQRSVDRLERGIRRRVTAQDLRGFEAVMRAVAETTQVQVRPGSKP